MADNFETNLGSGGKTFASDDVGGIDYARTKITIGADGVTDGDVSSANPLPVTGTVTANLSATDNAVLDAIAALLGTIDEDTSNITACNTGAVVVSSGTITANLSATDNAVLDDIAANQTDASQKTQLVDGSGNVIGATSNALDVNIKSGASSGTQYTEGDTDASITGTAMLMEGGTNTLVAAQGTAADGLLVNLGTNNDVTVTSGAITATLGAETTKVIGTVNVSAGQTIAVTNAGTFVTQSVVTNAGTFAVQAVCTNAGTFATQATLSAETTKVIGTVNVAAAQTIAVTNAGTFATQSVVTNAGTFAVQAACVLGAETTKVIGTVNIAAAQTLATVTTVGAVTAITNALPAGTNAIGKLAANNGVDIGDVDVASIAAGDNNIGNVDIVTIAAGQGVVAQASTSVAYDGTTSCTIKRLSGIATASGANTILTAVADKKFRVLALSLLATSSTAVVAYVYNGDYMLLGDGTNKLTLDLDGVGGPAGVVLPFNQGGWFQTDTANEALAINLGGATPVIWCVTYLEVA